MNARKALLAVALALTATLASCGTLRRAGKDIFIGVTSPYLIIHGGATDGYVAAQGVRQGLDSGSVMEVVAFPFTFLYHACGHALYCVIHVVDLPLCAFYGFTELPPASADVQPLDFYQGTWFDKEPTGSGTDATSGEQLPPGYPK